MRGGHLGEPLWTQARVLLELRNSGRRPGREVWLRRPHALIGRIVGADIAIADSAVAARHAYLHADDRGLCVIDLGTRAGTFVNEHKVASSWLKIGDVIRIANREIVIRDILINGESLPTRECRDELLGDSDERMLINLSLRPKRDPEATWLIGSELIFFGQGEMCGIRLSGGAAAQTHCALLRDSTRAYVIDLLVQQTRINQQIVRGAARLDDGDVLTIGQEAFTVHIEPFSGEHASHSGLGRSTTRPIASSDAAASLPPTRELGLGAQPPPPAPLGDVESSVMAWMAAALRASHEEMHRRHSDMQTLLGDVVKQIQEDASIALDSHLERIDALQRELQELQQQVARARQHSTINDAVEVPIAPRSSMNSTETPVEKCNIPAPPHEAPPSAPSKVGTALAPLISPGLLASYGFDAGLVDGLHPPAATPDVVDELVGPPEPVSERSRATTAWLLTRIEQTETEGRFSLRNLFRFGRSSRPKYPPEIEAEAEDENGEDSAESEDLL